QSHQYQQDDKGNRNHGGTLPSHRRLAIHSALQARLLFVILQLGRGNSGNAKLTRDAFLLFLPVWQTKPCSTTELRNIEIPGDNNKAVCHTENTPFSQLPVIDLAVSVLCRAVIRQICVTKTSALAFWPEHQNRTSLNHGGDEITQQVIELFRPRFRFTGNLALCPVDKVTLFVCTHVVTMKSIDRKEGLRAHV